MRTPAPSAQKRFVAQLPCTGLPPTPHVPLLGREAPTPKNEVRPRRHAVDQHTPLRPIPLAMQRSPALDRPRMKAKAPSPLVPSSPIVRTPSKFAPYTGDRYTLEGVLGKGGFGLVSRMRAVRSGEVVAMKTIERAQLRSEYLRRMVAREIRIHQQLSSEGNRARLPATYHGLQPHALRVAAPRATGCIATGCSSTCPGCSPTATGCSLLRPGRSPTRAGPRVQTQACSPTHAAPRLQATRASWHCWR